MSLALFNWPKFSHILNYYCLFGSTSWQPAVWYDWPIVKLHFLKHNRTTPVPRYNEHLKLPIHEDQVEIRTPQGWRWEWSGVDISGRRLKVAEEPLPGSSIRRLIQVAPNLRTTTTMNCRLTSVKVVVTLKDSREQGSQNPSVLSFSSLKVISVRWVPHLPILSRCSHCGPVMS